VLRTFLLHWRPVVVAMWLIMLAVLLALLTRGDD